MTPEQREYSRRHAARMSTKELGELYGRGPSGFPPEAWAIIEAEVVRRERGARLAESQVDQMDGARDLIQLKRALTPHDLEVLNSELERRRKSVILAYALWFFLSFLGAHKFYLGKVGQGLLYVLGPTTAAVVVAVGAVAAEERSTKAGEVLALLGVAGILAFVIWWILDLFTLHRQTESVNERIERRLLSELKPGR